MFGDCEHLGTVVYNSALIFVLNFFLTCYVFLRSWLSAIVFSLMWYFYFFTLFTEFYAQRLLVNVMVFWIWRHLAAYSGHCSGPVTYCKTSKSRVLDCLVVSVLAGKAGKTYLISFPLNKIVLVI